MVRGPRRGVLLSTVRRVAREAEGVWAGGAYAHGGTAPHGGARGVLCGAELGEVALQLHAYLLLLDYSKGAYPTKVTPPNPNPNPNPNPTLHGGGGVRPASRLRLYSYTDYTLKACDAIHDELQDLLRQGQLAVSTQAPLAYYCYTSTHGVATLTVWLHSPWRLGVSTAAPQSAWPYC